MAPPVTATDSRLFRLAGGPAALDPGRGLAPGEAPPPPA